MLTFNGYTFTFWVLTTGNRYEPAQFALTETANGLIARADTLTYGDNSGSTPGLLEVIFARRENGFSWQARAEYAEPIRGIKVAVGPLPVGPFMLPPASEFTLKEDGPGRCFVYPDGYYPLRHNTSTGVEPRSGPLPHWTAQFVLLCAGDRTFYLHAREYPPRVKKLWLYRWGDHQEVRVYSEADACRRSTEYTAPTWFLDEVGDWRQAVDDHARWMAGAFGLRPFAERADTKPWLKDLALTVILHGRSHDGKIGHTFADMTQRLEELALSFSPRRTLIKLVGFEGRVDHAWPHNDPDPVLGGPAAFDIFMATARRFGFHVMPHLNVWGASYDNPETKQWLPYQVQDQEGHPVSWSWDYDEDEIAEDVFAYISPDAPEWRAVLRRKVREMIERYGIDTIFLDQAGTFVNDRRYDHFRGLKTLYTELRADLPAVQFTGEGATHEISASLYPLLSGISGGTEFVPEMYRRLFGPYIRQHGHSISLPPEPYRGVWFVSPGNWWTKEKYEAQEARAAQVGAIPTLNLTDRRIRLAGEAIKDVMVRARQYAPPG